MEQEEVVVEQVVVELPVVELDLIGGGTMACTNL